MAFGAKKGRKWRFRTNLSPFFFSIKGFGTSHGLFFKRTTRSHSIAFFHDRLSSLSTSLSSRQNKSLFHTILGIICVGTERKKKNYYCILYTSFFLLFAVNQFFE